MTPKQRLSAYSEKFWESALFAIGKTEALPVAAGLYSILRGGVRFFGYAVPGSCVSTAINLNFFSSGTCIPATTWLDTRISWATSAHAWSWVMYGGFALIIALWRRPPGSFNGWLAFMLVGVTVAYHEIYWFFTYWVVHPSSTWVILDPNIGYGSFVAMCGIGIAIFYLAGFQRFLDLRIFAAGLGLFTLYMVAWGSIGYPLTLDLLTGVAPPALFGVQWVDFIEFCSWMLAFMVTGFAYYAKMVKR